MSTLPTRQIGFLITYKSQSWISRETGIPRSTLSYVARGLRELPQQYKTTLTNTYGREAYAQLRNSGLSSYQANRWKWYIPETAQSVIDNTILKVKELTTYWIGKRNYALGRNLTESEIASQWDETEEEVKDALRKSQKPTEEIWGYGQPK